MPQIDQETINQTITEIFKVASGDKNATLNKVATRYVSMISKSFKSKTKPVVIDEHDGDTANIELIRACIVDITKQSLVNSIQEFEKHKASEFKHIWANAIAVTINQLKAGHIQAGQVSYIIEAHLEK